MCLCLFWVVPALRSAGLERIWRVALRESQPLTESCSGVFPSMSAPTVCPLLIPASSQLELRKQCFKMTEPLLFLLLPVSMGNLEWKWEWVVNFILTVKCTCGPLFNLELDFPESNQYICFSFFLSYCSSLLAIVRIYKYIGEFSWETRGESGGENLFLLLCL